MALNPQLLKILVCPETKTPVTLAGQDLVDTLNRRIQQGLLKNRAGRIVKEKIDAALVRADGKILYPIRQDIPLMLIEEGIELNFSS